MGLYGQPPRGRPELETITHWAHPLKKPRFDAPLDLSATYLSLFFLPFSSYVRGWNPKSVGIQGRQAGSSSPPKKGGRSIVGNLLSDLAGQDLSSSDNRRKGERKDLYFTNIKNHRKICEMARNVIFLFLLLWRPSMQQVRTLQKAMIRELQKKNHGKLVYCRSLSFSSTWTTTLTAPSATGASLRTSAPCGRGTRGRPRPRSPGLAAGRWTSGGSTPLEAAGEEGAGGDATTGRSTREMVRHEWEMSYTCCMDQTYQRVE